jgi:hypothetical protein
VVVVGAVVAVLELSVMELALVDVQITTENMVVQEEKRPLKTGSNWRSIIACLLW